MSRIFFSKNKNYSIVPFCPKCLNSFPFFQFIENNPPQIEISCPNCNSSEKVDFENYQKSLSPTLFEGTKKFCQRGINHERQQIAAVYYCPSCGENERLYCSKCLSLHNTFLPAHKTMLLGESIQESCDYHKNVPFKFFCTTCQKHICIECKENHKDHFCVDLLDESKRINLEKIKIQNKREEYTKNLDQIKNYYNYKLKQEISEINKLIDKNLEINNLILDFIQLFYLNFKPKKVNHFFIIKNIIHNQIDSAINLKELTSFQNIKLFCQTHLIVNNTHKKPFLDEANDNNDAFCLKKDICKKGYKFWLPSIEGIKENNIITKIAACTSDSLVVIFSADTLELLQQLEGHEMMVNSICQLNESTLASASADKTIIFWQLKGKEYEKLRVLKNHQDGVNKIISIDNGFVSCAKNGEIFIWNIGNFNNCDVLTQIKKNSSIQTILYLKKERTIVLVTEEGFMTFWDYTYGSQFNVREKIYCQFPNSICEFDDKICVCGKSPGKNKNEFTGMFWVIRKNGEVEFKNEGINGYSFLSLSLNCVLIGTAEGKIKCFNNQTKSIKEVENGNSAHLEHINAFVAINDKTIATCSTDCHIKLWNIDTEKICSY